MRTPSLMCTVVGLALALASPAWGQTSRCVVTFIATDSASLADYMTSGANQTHHLRAETDFETPPPAASDIRTNCDCAFEPGSTITSSEPFSLSCGNITLNGVTIEVGGFAAKAAGDMFVGLTAITAVGTNADATFDVGGVLDVADFSVVADGDIDVGAGQIPFIAFDLGGGASVHVEVTSGPLSGSDFVAAALGGDVTLAAMAIPAFQRARVTSYLDSSTGLGGNVVIAATAGSLDATDLEIIADGDASVTAQDDVGGNLW